MANRKMRTPASRKDAPSRVYRRRATLSDLEVARLMVETEMSRHTVRGWMLGKPVKPRTNGRLSRAAAKLGIEVRA